MIILLRLTFIFLSTAILSGQAQTGSDIENAFNDFWNANSSQSLSRSITAIRNTQVSFAEAYQHLNTGRTFSDKDALTTIHSYINSDGSEFYYALSIPQGYNPARPYQLRFDLHGGVGGRTSNQPRGNGEIRLPGAEQIHVTPYAWNDSPWWSDDQVDNIRAILDQVKRDYNVNENRVVLSGVSDGGTGAYYIAMRETTHFASILPLNSFIMVLANRRLDNGENFVGNLTNKPLFMINGGRDRLYPTSSVTPFVEYFAANGVTTEYYPQPNGEHNTRWWPEMQDPFEQFVNSHPRQPHPTSISWQVADAAKNNRAHWLIIDQVNPDSPGSIMSDLNRPKAAIGGFVQANQTIFKRTGNTGRVDVERHGNTIVATTHGVAAFSLLLSPEVIDFSKPVIVKANGNIVFEGDLTPNLDTLLKWAARDNDRTMLYGAELEIKL